MMRQLMLMLALAAAVTLGAAIVWLIAVEVPKAQRLHDKRISQQSPLPQTRSHQGRISAAVLMETA
ncbi:MAG TPA: hypothetical protein VK993_09395 [Chthoniobacterales bacterium]|nr:hypothetical protein [Chthoniobacterales bacterium]